MTRIGSIDGVLLAIQEDARAEIERMEREAASAIARWREEEAQCPVVVADADSRLSAARRQARERLAAGDAADRQATLEARDAWMTRVAALGRQRLGALDARARRDDLSRLSREALERLGQSPCELLVSEADAPLADPAWRETLAETSGRSIARVTATPEVGPGGCIAQTPGGRIRYDNTYDARVSRFASAWRARLGELYGQPCALASVASRHEGDDPA